MHNNLPTYISTVCSLYEIEYPVFYLPYNTMYSIRHTFAEHSVWFCLINLLNSDTRSATIMERVDTDQFLRCKFY